MDNILFLAHTEADGTLNKAALEALSSAVELKQALNGTLDVALWGAQIQPAADSIAACGATRFLAVCGEAFGPARFATDAAACEALVRASGATIVIAAATSRNARVMAAVAHRVGGCVDTHVTDVAASSGTPDGDSVVLSPAHRRLVDAAPSVPGFCCSTQDRVPRGRASLVPLLHS